MSKTFLLHSCSPSGIGTEPVGRDAGRSASGAAPDESLARMSVAVLVSTPGIDDSRVASAARRVRCKIASTG